MTPTNDAPVTVEPQDRLLFKMVVTGMVGPTKHLAIDRGGFDQDERMQYIARHRLAALASAPAGDGVILPVEPTPAMDEAFKAVRGGTFSERYAAMIAAAPAALARPRAAVGERPDDEALDPHLPDAVKSERRCGIQRSDWMTSWFVSWSPRNDNQNAEGPWSHWVALAHAVIAADEKAILALQSPPAKVEG